MSVRYSHVVLGAGISGLTIAWSILKKNPEARLLLLEATSRAGGWVQTIEKEGFLFELGPRSCRTKGAGRDLLELIEEIGLCEEVIPADPICKKRYLLQDGQLRSLPSGIGSLFSSGMAFSLLPLLWKEWHCPRSYDEDESIASFMERRFSSYWLNHFMDPLVSGIYAGEPEKLSLRSCFPPLFAWEQTHGSVLRGVLKQPKIPSAKKSSFVERFSKVSLITFRNGMETLTKRLACDLAPYIRYCCRVSAVQSEGDAQQIYLENGTVIEAEQIISTLPAYQAASLWPQAEELLKQIPYASVATVSFGYRRAFPTLRGFGYLIPSSQKEKVLGVVWDSAAFPLQNRHQEETRLTVMIGGTRMADFDFYSEQDFQRMALDAVHRHMGIRLLPDVMHTHIARKAIPQYPVGHHRLITDIQNLLPQNVTLRGTAFHGVALNDCVKAGKEKFSIKKL